MTLLKNSRPVPQDLADGKVLAPGDGVELSDDQLNEPHNARLVEEGVLAAPEERTKEDLRARLDELGADQPPSKASRDELLEAVAAAEAAAGQDGNPEKEGDH